MAKNAMAKVAYIILYHLIYLIQISLNLLRRKAVFALSSVLAIVSIRRHLLSVGVNCSRGSVRVLNIERWAKFHPCLQIWSAPRVG